MSTEARLASETVWNAIDSSSCDGLLNSVTGPSAHESDSAVDVLDQSRQLAAQGGSGLVCACGLVHWSLSHTGFCGRIFVLLTAPEMRKDRFGLHNFPFGTRGRALIVNFPLPTRGMSLNNARGHPDAIADVDLGGQYCSVALYARARANRPAPETLFAEGPSSRVWLWRNFPQDLFASGAARWPADFAAETMHTASHT